VRWPARPAELRAGLDLFVSFSIKGKRKESFLYKQKKNIKNFECINYSLQFDQLQKKSNNQKQSIWQNK
jgi:hypothetical protein